MENKDYSVLVVEDEKNMRELIVDYLVGKGLRAESAENGQQALEMLSKARVDLLLLDVMMPELDGYGVCRALRDAEESSLLYQSQQVPILFLSALGQEEDKLLGYQLGADDYITKPFSLAVLHAKVLAMLRRAEAHAERADAAQNALRIDPDRRIAVISGVEQKLPRKEFQLLEYLVSHPDRLLTRDQLLMAVWGYDYDGEDRTVDNHIRKLRSRGVMIETEYGLGYRYSPKGKG